MTRKYGTFLIALAVFGAGCGANEQTMSETTARTKNMTLATTKVTNTQAPATDRCSILGAIYRSNPVVVPPPQENVEDQSYASDDCDSTDSYRRVNFGEIGRYTFTWSTTRTAKPVVVEISRDGVLWQALSTQWSPSVPNSATADVKLKGEFRVRVRTAANK